MNLHKWLKDQYEAGNISASEIARRIKRAKSTVHDALTMERDPGYSLVIDMHQAALAILAENTQTQGREKTEEKQTIAEPELAAGEACA